MSDPRAVLYLFRPGHTLRDLGWHLREETWDHLGWFVDVDPNEKAYALFRADAAVECEAIHGPDREVVAVRHGPDCSLTARYVKGFTMGRVDFGDGLDSLPSVTD